MTADLHARIKAAVDETRTGWAQYMRLGHARLILRLCDHADDVLARHRPRNSKCEAHWGLRLPYPCPDVRALATAWLGDGWDQ